MAINVLAPTVCVTGADVLARGAALLDVAVDPRRSPLAASDLDLALGAAVRSLCPKATDCQVRDAVGTARAMFEAWLGGQDELDRHLPQRARLSAWMRVPRRQTVRLNLVAAAAQWRYDLLSELTGVTL
jgi:hypothetical protein